MISRFFNLIFFFLPLSHVFAHESRPAYLSLQELSFETYEVLWKVPTRGDNLRLSLNVDLPKGTEILSAKHTRFVNGACLETFKVKIPSGLAGSTIAIHGLAGTMTDALLRIHRLDGNILTFRLTPSHPSLKVPVKSNRLEVFGTYLRIGIEHILLGVDHLVFVLCLLLLLDGWRTIAATITAFTIGHSLTLALTTLRFIHLPVEPVEASIALSIILLANEIIRQNRRPEESTLKRPWAVAGLFGFVHGAGFASALAEVGLPRGDIVPALFAFNIGVEAGQILFISLVFLIIACGRRMKPSALQVKAFKTTLAYSIGTIFMFILMEKLSLFS